MKNETLRQLSVASLFCMVFLGACSEPQACIDAKTMYLADTKDLQDMKKMRGAEDWSNAANKLSALTKKMDALDASGDVGDALKSLSREIKSQADTAIKLHGKLDRESLEYNEWEYTERWKNLRVEASELARQCE